MRLRKYALGALTVLAMGVACAAVASPAWATEPGTEAKPACQLVANTPGDKPNLNGVGKRVGCSDTVTYFWVRVYKVIKLFPDTERAVNGTQYFQNGSLRAKGSCDGRGQYYTHVSTATGMSGDSVESERTELC